MGSTDNTNWPPYNYNSNSNSNSNYNGYRDCSQGICSIYCPQWCYLIFPPPPPFPSSNDDDSAMNFSPLIIVLIGVLASAFLLVTYYTIISKYCKRRANPINPSSQESENQNNSTTHDRWQHTGLDDTLIKSIGVCKYLKSGGRLVEGSDCAVCLSEFQEGESLRVLPKCNHAFHLPCIDTWLRSHSNCPLCRSHVMPGIPVPFQRPLESQITSSNFSVSSLVFQRRNDVVLVMPADTLHVQQDDDDDRDEVVVNVNVNVVTTNDQSLPKYPFHDHVEEITTSASLMSCQNPNLLISDILRIEEDDYEDGHEQVGPSKGENSKSSKRSKSVKRSVSASGRFMFTKNDDKGKDTILPN